MPQGDSPQWLLPADEGRGQESSVWEKKGLESLFQLSPPSCAVSSQLRVPARHLLLAWALPGTLCVPSASHALPAPPVPTPFSSGPTPGLWSHLAFHPPPPRLSQLCKHQRASRAGNGALGNRSRKDHGLGGGRVLPGPTFTPRKNGHTVQGEKAGCRTACAMWPVSRRQERGTCGSGG